MTDALGNRLVSHDLAGQAIGGRVGKDSSLKRCYEDEHRKHKKVLRAASERLCAETGTVLG